MAATTFTKLKDGTWGLRGPGLVEGQQVWVEKRDCARPVPKTVGKVLWTGNGISIATIGVTPKKTPKAPEPTPTITLDWSQAEAEDNDPSLNWEM